MDIKVETVDGKVRVRSPYNPQFVNQAKHTFNGRFSWKRGVPEWVFDARDEEGVREVLREVYGTDGTPVDLVDVRLHLDKLHSGKTLWVFGRQVAIRRSRDEDVRLGRGVVVVTGEFYGSGGSVKYPELTWKDGTVLEMRDVPRTLVEGSDELSDGSVEIVVRDQESELRAEVIRVRLEQLEAERDRLTADLEQIEPPLTWMLVCAHNPDADAVEPGPYGIEVPDEILRWGNEHGLNSDPDLYLLVSTRDRAGETVGQVDYITRCAPPTLVEQVVRALDSAAENES